MTLKPNKSKQRKPVKRKLLTFEIEQGTIVDTELTELKSLMGASYGAQAIRAALMIAANDHESIVVNGWTPFVRDRNEYDTYTIYEQHVHVPKELSADLYTAMAKVRAVLIKQLPYIKITNRVIFQYVIHHMVNKLRGVGNNGH